MIRCVTVSISLAGGEVVAWADILKIMRIMKTVDTWHVVKRRQASNVYCISYIWRTSLLYVYVGLHAFLPIKNAHTYPQSSSSSSSSLP